MTALEARVLEQLRRGPALQQERDIARALDLGDVLDVEVALHTLQARGLAHHCYVRGRAAVRERFPETRSVGWMAGLRADAFPTADDEQSPSVRTEQ